MLFVIHYLPFLMLLLCIYFGLVLGLFSFSLRLFVWIRGLCLGFGFCFWGLVFVVLVSCFFALVLVGV